MSLSFGAPSRNRVRNLFLAGTTAAATAAMLATAPSAAATPEKAAADVPDGAVRAMAAHPDISRAEARDRVRAQDTKDALADKLSRELGAGAAGAYLERATGRLVVNVTSTAAADRVRETTARPRVVERGMDRLTRIQAALQRQAVTGATLAIDVHANEVDVAVPSSKDNARTQAFLERARSYGDAVDVERPAAAPRTQAVYGGEAIYGGGYRCSTAFIASSGGTEYVLTAGHCTDAVSSWSVDEGYLGPTVGSSFPGNDYGLIRNDGGRNTVGQVIHNGGAYEITHAGNPPVGTYVCKTGSTTGTTCGYIQRYNVTVNYPSGTVGDLIETDVCTQSGDSGGALYTGGNEAVGIVSGGTTVPCNNPYFRSYFENATEALGAYGLTLE